MNHLEMKKGYQKVGELRDSFNGLANQVFGISFDSWFENGYWTNKYIPYSFINEGKVISNVSVNVIDLLVNGEEKKALQIGTVMTHPDYRNLGLSRKLLLEVLEEYKGKYDLMYLFANATVLDFYPKFGFERTSEVQFTLDINHTSNSHHSSIKKLDGRNVVDLQFIYEFAQNRKPLSLSFSTLHTEELLLFYCMNAFPNNIYYFENENIIVLYQLDEQHHLHVYDVITQGEMNLTSFLLSIAPASTKKIVLHFTPNKEEINYYTQTNFSGSEILFVKFESEAFLSDDFKHPITSQA